MNERTLAKLEWGQIQARLAAACASGWGKELASHLLPAIDRETVVCWQQETDEAVRLLWRQGQVPLEGIHDLRPSLQRAQRGGVLDPAQLLAIQTTIKTAQLLKRLLEMLDMENYVLLVKLGSAIGLFPELGQALARCLTAEGEVADTASPQLAAIRRQTRLLRTRIQEYLEGMLRNAGTQKYLQEPLVTLRGERYVIPVKQEYRLQVPGIVHDRSASGATLFVEPMAVVDMNNQLRQQVSAETDEVELVLWQLSEQVGQSAGDLWQTIKALASIDLILAKGRLAQEMKANRVTLASGSQLELKHARHPLLGATAVPTDIRLGDELQLIVITGPNTGGKTVTLKTVGLLQVMYQAGLQIPAASSSELGVFTKIFVDIGDEQSIEQSLSTFSGHLTNLIEVINHADSTTLVLLDELGAGTDPEEGGALAIAILEQLKEQGAMVIGTTHYSSLKAFAHSTPGAINASMEFDDETLRPTFRLLLGIPGSSNAFHIAERLGLPNTVLERARQLTTSEQQQVSQLLQDLAASRQASRQEHEQVATLRHQLEQQQADWDDEYNQRREAAWQRLQRSTTEARQMVQETKQQLRALLQEAQSIQQLGGRESIRDLEGLYRQVLETEARVNNRQEQQVMTPPKTRVQPYRPLQVGDRVMVQSLDQAGEVIGMTPGRGTLEIQLGLMKMTVKREDVSFIESGSRQGSTARSYGMSGSSNAIAASSPELHVRGTRVEEALLQVDKYLDTVILAGLNQVTIIHGKGTGALRSAISELLNHHPQVKTYRPGFPAEGGAGVTVVEMA